MKTEELYEAVTAQLIDEIERGAGNWKMPWHTFGAAGLAMSIDDRRYRGLNCLILSLTSAATGWHSNTWGTYRAWQRHGHQVTRGERGTKVLLWKKTESDPNGEAQDGARMFARTFTVFAQEQTDAPLPEIGATEHEAAPAGYPNAAKALAATRAKVTASAQPHYNKVTDAIDADYLSDWLRILRSDDRAILTAASKAQAAVDHLHQLAANSRTANTG